MILKYQNLKINSQIIFTLLFLKTSKTLFQKTIPLQKVLSHQNGNKSKSHKQINNQSISYQTAIPTFHRQKIVLQPHIYNLLKNFTKFWRLQSPEETSAECAKLEPEGIVDVDVFDGNNSVLFGSKWMHRVLFKRPQRITIETLEKVGIA